MTPLLTIAAGGTGGHMFPAQALAEAMVARGWRVRLSTDERGMRYAGGFPDAVERTVVPSATPARGGLLAKLGVGPRIAAGVSRAAMGMRADRPHVVAGFGGYPSIPALSAASILRVPAIIHEQNGVPGRVNRLFAPRVGTVACGTWPTALPEGVEGVHVGNPVRSAVEARANAPYIPPGEHPMRLLVLGGSQGARILSRTVPAAVALLPEGVRAHLRVDHQARPEDLDDASAGYDAAGVRADLRPFFDDVPERLAEAQLVVSRAGASTLADIATVGRPAILVPYAAAAGDHQSANARGPAEAGAAIVIPESKLSPTSLAEQMELVIGDPGGATRMARAAAALAVPDAAERLAALVERAAAEHQEQTA